MAQALTSPTRSWQVALALIVAAFVIRWQIFGNPVLEFDEQYYLLVGDRMLTGAIPYVDLFDRKPIGLFLIYAAIRLLGGEGIWEYQIVSTLFAAATAFLLYRFARRLTGVVGAVLAALAYLLWLNINEGEGGQTPVFYNLYMIGAATLVWGAVHAERALLWPGVGAMLLAGLAIQTKYTPIVEGIYFGCVLLWAAYARGLAWSRIAALGAAWVAAALLPTALVCLWFWTNGYWDAFAFANFQSQLGRGDFPVLMRAAGLAAIIGILVPLLACVRRPAAGHEHDSWRFAVGWLVTALASILIFGSFMSTHYGMPVLLPAVLAAAPFFGSATRLRRRMTIAILGVVAIAGQGALAVNEWAKGGNDDARIVAAAARPDPGEYLYVYDGYPALYHLTRSPLPTRYAFPGHLNTADEGSASALGVDPVVELRRILATRPQVIVDDDPIYRFANLNTRAVLNAALARDYRLVLRHRTGSARFRLVYRRIDT